MISCSSRILKQRLDDRRGTSSNAIRSSGTLSEIPYLCHLDEVLDEMSVVEMFTLEELFQAKKI